MEHASTPQPRGQKGEILLGDRKRCFGKSAARAAVAVGGLVAMAFENRERDEVAARKGGLVCKLKDPEIRGLMHIFGSRRIIVIQNRGLLA